MTPEQAIKIEAFRRLLASAQDNPIKDYTYPEFVDETNLDEAWAGWNDVNGWMRDELDSIRCAGVESGLSFRGDYRFIRNYECHEVAAFVCGRWIGWTYWHGGGKHGEPEGIPWMSEAYFLNLKEKERVAIMRTFVHADTGEEGSPVLVDRDKGSSPENPASPLAPDIAQLREALAKARSQLKCLHKWRSEHGAQGHGIECYTEVCTRCGTFRPCSFEGCENTACAEGYCATHIGLARAAVSAENPPLAEQIRERNALLRECLDYLDTSLRGCEEVRDSIERLAARG